MNRAWLLAILMILSSLSGCLGEDEQNGDEIQPSEEIVSSDGPVIRGCLNSSATNYDSSATQDDGSCVFDTDGDGILDSDEVSGCTGPSANNYNSAATDDDGSCDYDADDDGIDDVDEIKGCTDESANNHDQTATDDDGSCDYDADDDGIVDRNEIEGCMDQTAINFDQEATDDDGSCMYDNSDDGNTSTGDASEPSVNITLHSVSFSGTSEDKSNWILISLIHGSDAERWQDHVEVTITVNGTDMFPGLDVSNPYNITITLPANLEYDQTYMWRFKAVAKDNGETILDIVGNITTPEPVISNLKILCLHGGGDSASNFELDNGMQDLMQALPNYDFFFPNTPESNGVWVRDPPGGKGEGTSDPAWADNSVNHLDQYVAENGPFHAILGYSQGAAMAVIYLAYSEVVFDRVILFNGYLETGHRGLMDTINASSPFSPPALIFEGEDDTWFGYGSAELAERFSDATHLVGDAGHHPPVDSDREFDNVVSWISEGHPSSAPTYDPNDLGQFWMDFFFCQATGERPLVDDLTTSQTETLQCENTLELNETHVVISTNGVPNHDFESTLACSQAGDCTSAQDYTWSIPRSPTPDTTGGHSSTNCPEANGNYECAAERGSIAVAINGVPIFGPEDGPGGDAVASHHGVFTEDRQPIELGVCHGHAAQGGTFHYHADSNCMHWHPDEGENIKDHYDNSAPDVVAQNTNDGNHSKVIGVAFDGYPIYGFWGYDNDMNVVEMKSSYELKDGETGYNGIDDYKFTEGLGHLDVCNGHYGPTPDFPQGIYHYHTTMLNGAGAMGFPYFLICYHGVADMTSDGGGGQGGGTDCSGFGETWGPGIGPPPPGCEGGSRNGVAASSSMMLFIPSPESAIHIPVMAQRGEEPARIEAEYVE